jgi:hypothetical protein
MHPALPETLSIESSNRAWRWVKTSHYQCECVVPAFNDPKLTVDGQIDTLFPAAWARTLSGMRRRELLAGLRAGPADASTIRPLGE